MDGVVALLRNRQRCCCSHGIDIYCCYLTSYIHRNGGNYHSSIFILSIPPSSISTYFDLVWGMEPVAALYTIVKISVHHRAENTVRRSNNQLKIHQKMKSCLHDDYFWDPAQCSATISALNEGWTEHVLHIVVSRLASLYHHLTLFLLMNLSRFLRTPLFHQDLHFTLFLFQTLSTLHLSNFQRWQMLSSSAQRNELHKLRQQQEHCCDRVTLRLQTAAVHLHFHRLSFYNRSLTEAFCPPEESSVRIQKLRLFVQVVLLGIQEFFQHFSSHCCYVKAASFPMFLIMRWLRKPTVYPR